MIGFLNIAIPALYAVTVWTYGKAFFSDVPWARQAKTKLLILVLATHVAYLFARTAAFDHPPVTTVWEILTVLAFSIATTYLIIEIRSNRKETGYFILNMALFFQLASSLFIRDTPVVPEVLRNNLFGLHVTAALLGYSAITISAVYGFLYLMLYHEIKASRFGVIYRKLPNLETLEQMAVTAIALAFILLGAAMVVGFIWLPQTLLHFSYADPKLIGTFIIWLIYGLAIIAKRSGQWKGRKMMILAICGFAISIFSMTVVNMFFSGFHNFY
ncbi:MAG: cytochrome c biogenesis protein CcsA [Bacteroidota bacterium]